MKLAVDAAPTASGAFVMGLLALGVPLSLLMDLATGPRSWELLKQEGAVSTSGVVHPRLSLDANLERRA